MLIAESAISGICNPDNGVINIVHVIGWALLIFRIAVPFIIVFYGMLDFGKAVTAEKPDEIKASAKRLLYRAIAGVIIYFVPAIIVWIFTAMTNFGEEKGSFDNCEACLLHPASGECETSGGNG